MAIAATDSLRISARIRAIDDSITRHPAAYTAAAIAVVATMGLFSYAVGQAEVTVVLSLLTLYASLRFRARAVYLVVLTAHVATTFWVMWALQALPLLALAAATASVLLYAELSFRAARSRESIDAERRRHLLNLDLLEQIRTSIARELDESAVAQLAVDAIARVIGYPRVAIHQVEGDSLTLVRQSGWPSPWPRITREAGILWRAIRTKAVQFVPEINQDPDYTGPRPGSGSEIAAPVFDGDAAIAVINVETSPGEYRWPMSRADISLVVSVAQEIGIAMSRARLDEAAKRERDQFEQVTRALGQALCIYDQEGEPVYINSAFERLLGWTLPELQRQTLAGLVEPEQIPRLKASFDGWRAGVFGSSEMTLAHRDGTRIPFVVTTSPRSLVGTSNGGVGVLTDLRDVKRAHQALEASERRLRVLYLESERRSRILEARDQLSAALAFELDPDAIGRAAVEAISRSLGYLHVTLYTLDGDWLVMRYQLGWTQVWPRIHTSHGVTGRSIRTRQTQYAPRIADDPDYINPLPNGRSAISCPVFDGGEAIGALFIETTAEDDAPDLGPLDIAMIGAVSEQIGIALGRARLYAEVERDRDLNAQVMSALGQGLVILDASASAEYVNPAFTQFTGRTATGLDLAALSGMAAGPDGPALESAIRSALAGKRQSIEISFRNGAGAVMPALVSLSPRSLDNAIGGCVAIITDLKQIRDTQRALEQSEARFRQLYQDAELRRRELEALDTIREAILNKPALDDVLGAVADFIHTDLGYPSVTISRLEEDSLRLLRARGSEAAPARTPLTRLSGQAIARKTPIMTRAGSVDRLATLSEDTQSQIVVPLLNGEEVFGVLTVSSGQANAFDDSDLRMLTLIGQNLSVALARAQLISALEAARDQALHASRAKSEFLTMMSHELRTPLNVILGGTELLQATIVRSDQRELAQMTAEAGQNLLDIINDVLDLARIEAGKVELAFEDAPIDQIAQSVFRLLEAQAAVKGLHLLCSVDLPGIFVRCDPKRARQVLLNLLANAIKFTQSGSIELRVTAEDAGARVTVIDTGPGIRAADLERLFRPFSQVDSTSTRRHGGTGLGLAISRQLVELMGGEIGVESAPGKGSAFWFTLPAARSGNRIIPPSP